MAHGSGSVAAVRYGTYCTSVPNTGGKWYNRQPVVFEEFGPSRNPWENDALTNKIRDVTTGCINQQT